MSYIQLKKIHSHLKRLISLILVTLLFSAIYYSLPSAPAAANNEMLINEVELNPAGSDSGAEKVELYNPSGSAIDVNGWTISSTVGRTTTIIINEKTIIPPKGFLIVGRDSQQWLDNTGEGIELRNDSGILLDYVGPFSDGDNDDATWQRSPDGGEREEQEEQYN